MMKKIFGAVLAAVVICASVLSAAVTLSGDNILPPFMGTAMYAAPANQYAELLPSGCAVMAEKDFQPERGDLVVYSSGGKISVGAVLGQEEGEMHLLDGEERVVPFEDVKGRIFYRIDGLGRVIMFIKNNSDAVRVTDAAILGAILIWYATLPSRRRRAEVRGLIELFDYYGRKFDEEEEGIDY